MRLYQESQVICFSGVNGEQIGVRSWTSTEYFLSCFGTSSYFDILMWFGMGKQSEHMLEYNILIWPFISQKVALMRSTERGAAEKRCVFTF